MYFHHTVVRLLAARNSNGLSSKIGSRKKYSQFCQESFYLIFNFTELIKLTMSKLENPVDTSNYKMDHRAGCLIAQPLLEIIVMVTIRLLGICTSFRFQKLVGLMNFLFSFKGTRDWKLMHREAIIYDDVSFNHQNVKPHIRGLVVGQVELKPSL